MIGAPGQFLFLTSLLAALGACSGGGSGGGASDESGGSAVVSGAQTGPITPFTPRDQASTTTAYTPGADTVLAVWKSRLTFFDGTVSKPAALALDLQPTGVTQTGGLQLVSPLLTFKAADASGATLGRETLRKNLKIETIVDRYVDEKHTVVLMLLNYNTPAEKRYMILPADLSVTVQDDKSRLVVFETRDTDFAFAVAVTKDGKTTADYGAYPAVPKDSSGLTGVSDDLDDVASGVKLSWTPAEGSRTGYKLQSAYAPFTTTSCEDGWIVDNAAVVEKRQSFPTKVFSDTYFLKDLTSDQTVYIQLCSINERQPPDVSPGINLTYVLPKRAKAVLTGTPPDPANATVLDVTVGGDGVTQYQYALLADAASCDSAAYGSWTDVSTKITDPLTEGAKRLCVLGKKSDKNVQTVPTEYAWTEDLTPPGAFTIDAVTTPTNVAAPVFTWQPAAGVSVYDVKIAQDPGCIAVVQTLSPAVETATPAALAEGIYYLCVTAVDAATNRTQAANGAQIFTVDLTPPVFTSLALLNDAADGYINSAERLLTQPLAGPLVASGYTVAGYKLAGNAAACGGSLTYAPSVPADDSIDFGADGAYKVCVKLADAAGNVTYGASTSFTKDTAAPVFTALPLANHAADTYINATEHALSAALAGAVAGSGYTLDDYKLAASAVACDAALTYGAMPLDNAAAFGGDGAYKVCMRLRDVAGNITYGASSALTLDTTYPVFTSVALANAAVDGYVNLAEHSGSGDLVASLAASGQDSVGYKLVAASSTCNGSLTYGAIPAANSTDFGGDGSYKVCVQLDDHAGNKTYGASAAFTLDTAVPVFTSLNLAGDAADTYINAAESVLTNPVASGLVAAGYDTAAYVLVTNATTCDVALTYGGGVPLDNAAEFTGDGDYKVCVKLTDAAGNPPAYGASAPIHRDTAPPVFTSVALAGGAVDGYINAADVLAAGALVSAATGTDFDTAKYKVAASATTCDGALTYGPALPLANSADFGSDGSYKICVKLTDAAGNPAAYGASAAFSLDRTQPAFTSLALAGDAADGYVNAAERAHATDLADSLTALGYDTAGYKLVSAATACNGALTYGGMPASNTSDFGSDGSYKICVKLTDAAGNPPAYGASAAFTLDTQAPSATDITSAASNVAYKAGAALTLALTFDEAVHLSGAGDVLLKLETGTVDEDAVYQSGDGTATLLFSYVVQSGDSSGDLTTNAAAPQLHYTATRGLADAAGNPVTTDVGAATSLASNKNLVVDTTPPAAFSITAPTSGGTVTKNTPLISWSDPGDADAYDVKIDDASDCSSPAQSFVGVTALSQAVATLADGVWYVCVTAKDNAGNTAASANDGLAFTVTTGTWAATPMPSAPDARRGATAVWSGSRMLVWGGESSGTYFDTGGEYDPAGGWVATDTSDVDRPSGRWHHTAVWTGSAMIVWGGEDGVGRLATGGIYLPGGPDYWTATNSADPSRPSARRGHSAVWTGTAMLIWGGHDGSSAVNSGAAYDPTGDSWTTLDASDPDAPSPREQHTAVWTGSKMLIWGGTNGAALNTGAVYDPAAGDKWTPIATFGAPSARYGHTAVWSGGKMIVFGGQSGGTYLNDGAMYDPATDMWTTLSAVDAPTARSRHAAVADGSGKMVVWGGYDGASYLASGAVFDGTSNVWTVPAVNAASAPTARADAAAVWDGTEMVVVGGYDGAAVGTGAKYTPP